MSNFFFWLLLWCALWQHYYKARKGLGESRTPAERDLCGLCAFSVSHPAGQPWTRVAHRRYRCCMARFILGALLTFLSQSPHRLPNFGCCRHWQESCNIAHKLGVWLNLFSLSFILWHVCVCFLHDSFLKFFPHIVPRCFCNHQHFTVKPISFWTKCW